MFLLWYLQASWLLNNIPDSWTFVCLTGIHYIWAEAEIQIKYVYLSIYPNGQTL